tara:strand:+ start:533 stop:706 length:174 start_codon:yes stop_codon:yes gene_type:complete
MGLSRIGAVRVFDKWALGLCLIPDLPSHRDGARVAVETRSAQPCFNEDLQRAQSEAF